MQIPQSTNSKENIYKDYANEINKVNSHKLYMHFIIIHQPCNIRQEVSFLKGGADSSINSWQAKKRQLPKMGGGERSTPLTYISLFVFLFFLFNFFYLVSKKWGGGDSLIISFIICKFKNNLCCDKKYPPPPSPLMLRAWTSFIEQ